MAPASRWCSHFSTGGSLNSAFLPSAGQFVTDGNATDALFDPIVGVAFVLIEFPHPLLGKLWILDFLDALVSDLRQPAFERFGLGAGDGLDDAESGFGVDRISLVPFSVSGG